MLLSGLSYVPSWMTWSLNKADLNFYMAQGLLSYPLPQDLICSFLPVFQRGFAHLAVGETLRAVWFPS